jgi:hypothetical protein
VLVPVIALLLTQSPQVLVPVIALLLTQSPQVLVPVIGRLSAMPVLILAAQLCPDSVEATLYALIMGICNMSFSTGNYIGVRPSTLPNQPRRSPVPKDALPNPNELIRTITVRERSEAELRGGSCAPE